VASDDLNKTAGVETTRLAVEEVDMERRLLALDALSKLTERFSRDRSLEESMKMFLWTLSGQLSSPNAFTVIRSRRSDCRDSLRFATGNFEANKCVHNTDWCSYDYSYFFKRPGVHSVDLLVDKDEIRVLAGELSDMGVKLVCPLLHEDEFIGFVGIGQKVGKRAFSDDDMAIMLLLANTLTPFIVNALLYQEMSSLYSWYSEILSSVRQGVVVFDKDFRLKTLNSSAQTILGDLLEISEVETTMEGRHLSDVLPEKIFPGLADRLTEASHNDSTAAVKNMVVRNGQREGVFNYQVVRTNASESSYHDYILTIDDVTEQVFSERKMIDLHRLADKGLMASSIAHELNNFLGMIIGGVQLASLAFSKEDKSGLRNNIVRLEQASLAMKRYVSGLTSFVKIETSQQVADLNTVINDVLSFARVQKRFSHIAIVHDLDPSIANIRIDKDQIAQVLLNFINNASDAIRDARRANGKISVVTSIGDSGVEMSVTDNGIGMTPEIRERLFDERFTTKIDGHGFGLYTCAEIASAHNAMIEVKSEPGEGSTFSVSFPLD